MDKPLLLVWNATDEMYLILDGDTIVYRFPGPGVLADIIPRAERVAKNRGGKLELDEFGEVVL